MGRRPGYGLWHPLRSLSGPENHGGREFLPVGFGSQLRGNPELQFLNGQLRGQTPSGTSPGFFVWSWPHRSRTGLASGSYMAVHSWIWRRRCGAARWLFDQQTLTLQPAAVRKCNVSQFCGIVW